MKSIVSITRSVDRVLRRIPRHVVLKLMGWVDAVETFGLAEVRKLPGYHDEPLKGKRKGQRSIRLSRSYRAVYSVDPVRVGSEPVQVVVVEEVSKHDY